MTSRTTTGSQTASKTTTKPSSPQSTLPENTCDGGHSQFFWTYTEEPHRSRRQAIIKAHPEVTKLCGPEPLTKWLVLAVVLLQVVCGILLRNTHWLDWRFLATAYVVGATSNQNLFLAIHEISHNLAFKEGWKNRLLAVFANLPIGIPYSASFRVCVCIQCYFQNNIVVSCCAWV
jgi:sphingolipid delta-4 desaturase